MTDAPCPKCGSKEAYTEKYLGTSCIICDACGYDERDDLDVTPQEKGGKGKGSYSPYQAGGGARTRK